MVVPSIRAFDKENPQAGMAGAFGLGYDPDLRKGVLLRNLFPLITVDNEVPQTTQWARDITSLSAISKLDNMTRPFVATAGFVSGDKVWREDELRVGAQRKGNKAALRCLLVWRVEYVLQSPVAHPFQYPASADGRVGEYADYEQAGKWMVTPTRRT